MLYSSHKAADYGLLPRWRRFDHAGLTVTRINLLVGVGVGWFVELCQNGWRHRRCGTYEEAQPPAWAPAEVGRLQRGLGGRI